MRFTAMMAGALALALGGCQQDLMLSNAGPSRDTLSCASSGGTIQARGRRQLPTCVHPYADAGQACSGKKDCQGRCIATAGAEGLPKSGEAVLGHCEPDDKLFGCYAEVEGGKAKSAVCVD